MGAKHFGRALLVALACPGVAFALGLGDIKLNSALNAPLDADIELLGAAPEELATLKAQLASRETFARYGLDYPGFLSSVTLARGKSTAGRDVLKVRSQESITEPFVTLLVDVNWGRGRLVREYTVLLDPPVFTPGNSQAAPVAPPVTGTPRAGTIERAAPPSAAVPPASEAPATDSYRVRGGDTLSRIAAGLAGSYAGATRDQLMLGLYRNNPGAFVDSMNALRNGAILRLPAPSAVSGISAAAAAGETSRQYSAWRGRSGSATGSGAGRLRLVAPSESGSGSAATAADVKGLRDRLTQIEGELAESKRLLELKNGELADLQRRLSAASAGGRTPAATPATPPVQVAAPPVAAATPAVKPPAEQAPTAPATTPSSGTPEPAAVAPAEQPAVQPMRPRARVVEQPSVEGPSFLSSLLDSVVSAARDFWYIPVALIIGLLGLFGFRKFQQQRTTGRDDFAMPRYEMSEPPPARASAEEADSDTARLRRPRIQGQDERGMLVEESGENEQPKFASDMAQRSEDTLSGETGINLDQNDPLAEADFHMAYGLYDQAADLVRTAIVREPERRDLKLKLVEVFFVWGNRDEFLKVARDLHGSRAQAPAGEWDKIVIMGRQIAPEDPLFSGAPTTGAPTREVDLDLHAGESKLDFDLLGEASAGSAAGAAVGGATATALDLDFGATPPGDTLNDTTEQSIATAFAPLLPDALDDRGGGTTREMAPQFPPASADAGELSAADLGEAPTVEQPLLRTNSPTIRQKIDAVLRQANTANDQTAEVAIDDLGLDLGEGLDLDHPEWSADAPSDLHGDVHADLHADVPGDTPTLVAGLDAESRRLLDAAAATPTGATALTATGDWFTGTKTERDTNATASMVALDVDLSDSAATAQFAPERDLDIDLERMGSADNEKTATSHTALADELSLPALEPMTISEVGTKLDLARAYMDMGDPDGARSILLEVVHEGSISQKQEAQRLIDSLPG